VKKILFLAAILATFSGAAAAEKIPENLKKTLDFKNEIYDFYLPLRKNPDFLTREISEKKKNFEFWGDKIPEKSPPKKFGKWHLDRQKFREFVDEYLVPKIERDPQNVRIFRDENGKIQFDGAGVDGRKIDFEALLAAANLAIENDFPPIQIPLKTTPPKISVDDPELRKMGISDLLAVGESDFSRSSYSRIFNIEAGKNRFNGVLIPKGAIFSFNDLLGPVDKKHGFLPELVIVGPKLSKEYGGGLCQVSSTTFRAALLAGLPIVERHNHSFAVNHYRPWGTDATIYIGGKNFKFQNDTPAPILIQTTMDRKKQILRFHFYGKKDGRAARFFGPIISKKVPPLPPKVEYSEKIPDGEFEKVSNAVPGFHAAWTRIVLPGDQKLSAAKKSVYSFLSKYQPRADWKIVGGKPPEEKSE